MAAFETNRMVAAGTGVGVAGRLFAAVAAWNDARVTRKALSRLSDRELDDIGLSRSDIDAISARG
ncbi:DUF1127 domain-containing protein [Frigidibacter albus]|uniref:DUF1127 domain-containing protein n=1 Tax=Frigidibacter albus TaxID=1465486 RepID=A0A6L8VJB9_9RHOB|nr:DUF1127 domain-containing protein [Frigidibacter albus]MZQ89389.1 DUF1127 domain-containing protein [Frigidibacter albus]NBE31295.1 DUF1127 domain-containing protein [Frigidibacter albus]GGH53923.1 hypothetical protein GCM10011341_19870 [Frigidibacter albus]